MNQPPVFRIRVIYAKLQALRYTGSLDMQRIWERSFRRAGLPLAYSQGFHPQPRINQALPLPLGMTSRNDLVDFWLEQEMYLEEIVRPLNQAVPPGLEISAVEVVDLRAPSLPTIVKSAGYLVELLEPHPEEQVKASVQKLLSETQVLREKRGKWYDLRPLIEEITVVKPHLERIILTMQLSARDGATGRPDEVLLALGLDPLKTRTERSELILAA